MAGNASDKEPLIFLSYTRKDIARVRNLYKRLKEAGYKPWLDLEDLDVGDEWGLKVKETLERAPLFISCLSNHSVSHEGVVQWEIREALEIAKQKINIYFLPVRLDDCKVPTQIKKYHWVNLYEDDGFEKLLAAVRKGKPEAARREMGRILRHYGDTGWAERARRILRELEKPGEDSRQGQRRGLTPQNMTPIIPL